MKNTGFGYQFPNLLGLGFCVLTLSGWTNAAWAACNANEDLFMACAFENGKFVQVCTTDETARYSYGRKGETPELAMSLPFGRGAQAVPWNGVGREINEAVRLQNNDITYDVYAGFDRMIAAQALENGTDYKFGGIVVQDRTGDILAHLRCIPSTVGYAF